MKVMRYILALTAFVALTACTHNNGDIGPWFGTWVIDYVGSNPNTPAADLAVSGNDYTTTSVTIFLQFQGDIVSLRRVNNILHTEEAAYGTWSEGDGTLDITFPDGNLAYIYLMGLSRTGTNHFAIQNRKGNEMTLELLSFDADILIYYHIKKLY